MKNTLFLLISILVLVGCKQSASDTTSQKSAHKSPHLILTVKSARELRNQYHNYPILVRSFEKMKSIVDPEIEAGIDVPTPTDPAGGYTHNRNKQNYINMQGAGVLWQITRDEKYLNYTRDMLLEYAKMYPLLGLHPIKASYAPGKLFWQQLNEAVWLVYVSQAYDCIVEDITAKERLKIENDLIIPYAHFLSVENTSVFNRIHNHGVWSVVAVGMAGFVTGNEALIQHALYGVKDGTEAEHGSGFYAQLDQLFSPDGYYTEGPYYQRFALLPYVLFAQAIDNNQPDSKIFEYRGGILTKAVETTLQMTNTDGTFFPLNDALKEMSYMASELVHAVDIIYNNDDTRKELLTIAKEQNEVILSGAGLKVAKALANREDVPFVWKSAEYSDGQHGKQGAIGVLRSNESKDHQTVVMKYASQGMGHGHLDRLTMQFYDRGTEVLRDYGAARYVNVEYKDGGRYLQENKTWAQQTISHNTITVDHQSQSKGNVKIASTHHAESWIFDASNPEVQVMSAKETNAYNGIEMHRTIALLNIPEISTNAFVLDIFRVESDDSHTYTLPYYYNGHKMHTSVDLNSELNSLKAFGKDNGLQHLWVNSRTSITETQNMFVWLCGSSFYTLTSETKPGDEILFTTIGANDPDMNLRPERAVMYERKVNGSTLFVSTLESHGSKHPYTELVEGHTGHVQGVQTMIDNDRYTVVKVHFVNGKTLLFALANADHSNETEHSVRIGQETLSWVGGYQLFK